MKRFLSLGLAVGIAALLLASQAAMAQEQKTEWFFKALRIIKAYNDGELKEEIAWMIAEAAGEKVVGIFMTPQTPSMPHVFEVEGHSYTLIPHEADKMEPGLAYPFKVCSERFMKFLVDVGPCVSGGPELPNYSMTRYYNPIIGNSFTVEKK